MSTYSQNSPHRLQPLLRMRLRAVLSIVLGAWSVRCVGRVARVDCRCFLSFVFLSGARRLELSPCNTDGSHYYSPSNASSLHNQHAPLELLFVHSIHDTCQAGKVCPHNVNRVGLKDQ